jgi:DNA topoisomerase 2-associated protein PAT1
MIVVHIGILDVVRLAQLQPGESQLPAAIREEIELFSQAVMPSLFGYVNEAPLNMVVGLLGLLLDSANVQLVARTKIGLAILTTFVSRAELVKQAGGVSDQDVAQWYVVFPRTSVF